MVKHSTIEPLVTSKAYTERYKNQAFFQWYADGCPSLNSWRGPMQPDSNEMIPTEHTLWQWYKDGEWKSKAALLNAEVNKQIQQRLVEDRIEMLHRQAENGKFLQEVGMEFFKTHPVDTPQVALKAVIQGAELERFSRGIPDALLHVSEMDDSKLKSLVSRLIEGVSNPDTVSDAMKYDIDGVVSEIKDVETPVEDEKIEDAEDLAESIDHLMDKE